VQRIALFTKHKLLQAFVELSSVQDATVIKEGLHDCDIFPGCCNLCVTYSPTRTLTVRDNTDTSYNIDVGKENRMFWPTLESHTNTELANQQKLKALIVSTRGVADAEKMIEKAMNGRVSLDDIRTLSAQIINNHKHEPVKSKSLMEDTPSSCANKNNDTDSSNTKKDHSPNCAAQVYQVKSKKNRLPWQSWNKEVELEVTRGECVLMVSNINREKVNCNHLYNLFSCYGKVDLVKILVVDKGAQKQNSALVQFTHPFSVRFVVDNFKEVRVFGHGMRVDMSTLQNTLEHSDTHIASQLPDGTESIKKYNDIPWSERLYRNRRDMQDKVAAPSSVLSYTDAPQPFTTHQIDKFFQSLHAPTPIDHKVVTRRKHPGKRPASMGVLVFASVTAAVEAVMICNHHPLFEEGLNTPLNIKLNFSPTKYIF